jgi:hypothetical protein
MSGIWGVDLSAVLGEFPGTEGGGWHRRSWLKEYSGGCPPACTIHGASPFLDGFRDKSPTALALTKMVKWGGFF